MKAYKGEWMIEGTLQEIKEVIGTEKMVVPVINKVVKAKKRRVFGTHTRWRKCDDKKLKSLIASGWKLKRIAREFGRTEHAISCRIYVLGIKKKSKTDGRTVFLAKINTIAGTYIKNGISRKLAYTKAVQDYRNTLCPEKGVN